MVFKSTVLFCRGLVTGSGIFPINIKKNLMGNGGSKACESVGLPLGQNLSRIVCGVAAVIDFCARICAKAGLGLPFGHHRHPAKNVDNEILLQKPHIVQGIHDVNMSLSTSCQLEDEKGV